ncbi:two-component hybrid sensor and regulator [Candidatus Moduliflexus flocculans]|uniref:histidine kinase n=1 Tax=Candidatus Moduliflexus flocculans TaxID=1499966 RepID=A0A081BRL8_9BACT|nr:two-component hybrid sensor and regulator [Candidatus Moduliflexus flocculans]
MSHELRTPLNSILGYEQILEKADNLHDRQREGIRTIRESGEHLLTLITDILDMSKIEAGRMDVRPQEFHLHEFLKQIAKMIRVRAEQKRVSFVLGLDPMLPEYVASDERRLRQVLVNLLGNAIKFTDQGRVSLNVTCSNAEADRLLLRFEIADTGVGIASNDLSKLFEPFRQVGARRYAAEGTGLGLAISAKFIELLGGSLQVESEFGRGSRFWFELPVKTFSAHEALAAEYFADDVKGYADTRRAILVVDDKAANRAVLVNMLEPLGFQMLEADDGVSGLEVALARRPDLILLDLRMPGMDGFEMARQLRSQPVGQALKIVAVSASVQGDIKQLSLDAGCDDFLGKPVMLDELLWMLAAQLGITWLMADQSPMSENDTPATFQEPESARALPPEWTARMIEDAERGDIRAISKLIDQLAARDRQYAPLVEQLRQLAKSFQVDAILAIVRGMENDKNCS